MRKNYIVEKTGFKPGDRVKQYCARIYLEAGGLLVAYGDTKAEAKFMLTKEIEKNKEQS